MTNRDRIADMAHYILSQDHERENLIDNLSMEHVAGKKQLRILVEESMWYSAMYVLHGKREANKAVTELIKEVLK